MKLADIHLVLFLTRGASLQKWERTGSLAREVYLYKLLAAQLGSVTMVTYGDESDLAYLPQLDGIRVVCNRWQLPMLLYILLLPFLHWRTLRNAHIFKTNQIRGAEIALWAKVVHGKALIVRCGYVWSRNAQSQLANGLQGSVWEVRQARWIERITFRYADLGVTTTEALKRYLNDAYQLPPKRIRVIPNYVQTEMFTPKVDTDPCHKRLIFVGRLSALKNLSALLEATKQVKGHLTLIGEGPEQKALVEQAQRDDIAVEFLGTVPNQELTHYLHQADVFVLPSKWEGHPKVLIEAMACGMPVVGTDVAGIRDVLVHGQTGLLCGLSGAEIAGALMQLFHDPLLRSKLGKNARRFVEENYAVPQVMAQEIAALQIVMSGDQDAQ